MGEQSTSIPLLDKDLEEVKENATKILERREQYRQADLDHESVAQDPPDVPDSEALERYSKAFAALNPNNSIFNTCCAVCAMVSPF